MRCSQATASPCRCMEGSERAERACGWAPSCCAGAARDARQRRAGVAGCSMIRDGDTRTVRSKGRFVGFVRSRAGAVASPRTDRSACSLQPAKVQALLGIGRALAERAPAQLPDRLGSVVPEDVEGLEASQYSLNLDAPHSVLSVLLLMRRCAASVLITSESMQILGLGWVGTRWTRAL